MELNFTFSSCMEQVRFSVRVLREANKQPMSFVIYQTQKEVATLDTCQTFNMQLDKLSLEEKGKLKK